MLLAECEKGGVEVRLDTVIGEIDHGDGQFALAGATAPQLVIATGGESIPKMGATGIAYDIARQFGLDVVTPRPGSSAVHAGGGRPAVSQYLGGFLSGGGDGGRTLVSRSGVVHPQRAVGAGNIAGVVLLVAGRQRVDVIDGGWCGHADGCQAADAEIIHLKAALGEHLPARLAQALATRIGIETELGNVSDRALGKRGGVPD